jgi:hypothetical protein
MKLSVYAPKALRCEAGQSDKVRLNSVVGGSESSRNSISKRRRWDGDGLTHKMVAFLNDLVEPLQ